MLARDLGAGPLLVGLAVLWLLTAAFFIMIIVYPQREPTYQSEAPVIDGFKSAGAGVPSTPPGRLGGRAAPIGSSDAADAGSAAPEHTKDTTPAARAELPTFAVAAAEEVAQHHTPQRSQPTAKRAPLRSGGAGHDSMHSITADDEPIDRSGDHISFHGDADGEGASIRSSTRIVYLQAQPSARPRVAFYQSDDGFDVSILFSSTERYPLPPDEIVPIVLAAQPPVGGGGSSSLLAAGSLLGGTKSTEGTLRAGDVIIGVNGDYGLSALDVAAILESSLEPLRLTVRRVTMRKNGTKRSRAIGSLRHYKPKQVANCMLLYPQDSELQRAACERLTRSVIEASQRSSLAEFHEEVRSAVLLPVVINAMEVHWKNAPVLTAASRLLCCLANTEGHLRANVVAAGALPAMCVALGKHSGSEAVHALCDLAAEICSPRGSPAGSRRAMCEALASTGALKAVLTALRGHVDHQGVVAATCKILLAYQEEFGASGNLPPQLSKALRSSETLAALDEAQRRFTHSQQIQLGSEWASGVGRADRSRKVPQQQAS